ncbi:MAG: glycosyl hydrolase [Micromonosporaceae bacterium]
MSAPVPPRGASIPIGVYRGRGCGAAAIERYEEFLGRPVDYVLDFMAESPSSWAQFEAGCLTAGAGVSAWRGQLGDRRLVLGVPACCLGSGWADEAAGRNDSHWSALGSRLVSLGFGDAVLRVGREMNGSWYTWAVGEGGQAAYISGYRHVVSVLRAIPGASFRFCWSPYIGTGTLPSSGTESAYPGDAYVDEIGVDVYDGDWSGIYGGPADAITTTQQQQVWDRLLTEWDSLRGWYHLALSHGKPLCFPEWGLRLWRDAGAYHGGGDNAVLVQGMAEFITGSGAAWHAMWEDPWAPASATLTPSPAGPSPSRWPAPRSLPHSAAKGTNSVIAPFPPQRAA